MGLSQFIFGILIGGAAMAVVLWRVAVKWRDDVNKEKALAEQARQDVKRKEESIAKRMEGVRREEKRVADMAKKYDDFLDDVKMVNCLHELASRYKEWKDRLVSEDLSKAMNRAGFTVEEVVEAARKIGSSGTASAGYGGTHQERRGSQVVRSHTHASTCQFTPHPDGPWRKE